MNRIIFSTEVYSLVNILQAKEIYSDYADMTVEKVGNGVEVTFKKSKYDIKTTIKEFENYLIGLENAYGNH